MQKHNTNKRGRRAPRRKQPVGFSSFTAREYNAPQSQRITLHGNFAIASGITGNNGGLLVVNWVFFNDAAALALVYKYFEILSIRLRFSLSTTTAAQDSFQGCALAFFPINYLIEGLPTGVPTQRNQVQDLPGSIFVQQGTRNNGRWFSPQIKQQFATSDAFSTTLSRAAGALVWYAEDIGPSEVLGDIDLEITLRFYGREYAANPSLSQMLFSLVGKDRLPATTKPPDPSEKSEVVLE